MKIKLNHVEYEVQLSYSQFDGWQVTTQGLTGFSDKSMDEAILDLAYLLSQAENQKRAER